MLVSRLAAGIRDVLGQQDFTQGVAQRKVSLAREMNALSKEHGTSLGSPARTCSQLKAVGQRLGFAAHTIQRRLDERGVRRRDTHGRERS